MTVEPGHGADPDAGVKPNLLIAGAARSGTTALSESLARHSDIRMSSPKEVHFFIHANTPPSYTGPGDEVMMAKVVSDPEQFAELWRGSTERYRAEGSVTTLYDPATSIPNIQQFCDPTVRVVCMLREPVARAHSAFLYLRSRGYEPLETMAEGLRAEDQRRSDGYHHMWHYEAMSRYHEQLPQLADAFGDRLHVVVFEEYRHNQRAELERLCEFLDLDFEESMLIETDINRGGEVRSATLARLVDAARGAPLVRDAVTRLVPRVVRDRIRAKNLHRPTLDPATAQHLGERLRPVTAAVEELLGRPLPAWQDPNSA